MAFSILLPRFASVAAHPGSASRKCTTRLGRHKMTFYFLNPRRIPQDSAMRALPKSMKEPGSGTALA